MTETIEAKKSDGTTNESSTKTSNMQTNSALPPEEG